MPSLIAFGNCQQFFPFDDIPSSLVPDSLYRPTNDFARVLQRFQARRLAHFLLWQLLQKADLPVTLLAQIQRTTSDRPYFPTPHIDFNISHSGDWVAVILQWQASEVSAVGIDVEWGKIRNFDALMAHFASDNEIAWFAEQDDAKAAFYRCWCVREALLKSQGVGIAKLSEVEHQAQSLQLFSPHCPTGHLWLSRGLPVHLAAFVKQEATAPTLWHWQAGKLQSYSMDEMLCYRVNPSVDSATD